jgi:hypothetical protein
MRFTPTALAMTVLLLAVLAAGGCNEKPQRLASAEKPGYQTDAWEDQHRGRTLRQSESGRIYH